LLVINGGENMAKATFAASEETVKDALEEYKENANLKKVVIVEESMPIEEEKIDGDGNIAVTANGDKIYCSINRDVTIDYLSRVLRYTNKKINKFKTVIEALK